MCWTLSAPSYWTDEGATLEAARSSLPDLWHMLRHMDAVHGLYYLMMHEWVALFGDSEFAARLPSALAYAVTVFATLRVASLLRVKTDGVCATGVILLVLPSLTASGMDARGFVFAAMSFALCALCAVEAIHRPRTIYLVGVVFFMATCLFFEVYAVILLPLYVALVLRFGGRVKKQLLWAMGPMLTCLIPFGLLVHSEQAQLDASEGAGSRTMAVVLKAFFIGPRDGFAHQVFQQALCWGAAIIVLGVLFYGAVSRRDSLVRWALLVAYTPFIVVYVVAFVKPALFAEHYFTFATPALAFAFGAAWSELPGRALIRFAVLALVACMFIPQQIAQRDEAAKGGDDFRALVRTLPREKPDAVWFDAVSARSVQAAYPQSFRGVSDIRLRVTPADDGSLWGESWPVSQSRNRLGQVHSERVVVVYGRTGEGSSSGVKTLTALGCLRGVNQHEGRYSFQYFTCSK